MQRCDLQFKLHAPHKGWQFYFRRGTAATCMNCLFAKQTKIKPLSQSFAECMLLNVIQTLWYINRKYFSPLALKMTHVLMVLLIILHTISNGNRWICCLGLVVYISLFHLHGWFELLQLRGRSLLLVKQVFLRNVMYGNEIKFRFRVTHKKLSGLD